MPFCAGVAGSGSELETTIEIFLHGGRASETHVAVTRASSCCAASQRCQLMLSVEQVGHTRHVYTMMWLYTTSVAVRNGLCCPENCSRRRNMVRAAGARASNSAPQGLPVRDRRKTVRPSGCTELQFSIPFVVSSSCSSCVCAEGSSHQARCTS